MLTTVVKRMMRTRMVIASEDLGTDRLWWPFSRVYAGASATT